MSIINHKFKHIFIHVPKCGGRSMSKVGWVGQHKMHDSVQEYLDQGKWRSDYFSWAFVRNPYERAVSAYYWASFVAPPRDTRNIPDITKRSFQDYIDWVEEEGACINYINQRQIIFLCQKGMTTPYVDFIGRFENLQEDWAYLSRRVTGSVVPLPKINQSVNRRKTPWQYHYTEKLRKTVYDLYQYDFQAFNYSPDIK